MQHAVLHQRRMRGATRGKRAATLALGVVRVLRGALAGAWLLLCPHGAALLRGGVQVVNNG